MRGRLGWLAAVAVLAGGSAAAQDPPKPPAAAEDRTALVAEDRELSRRALQEYSRGNHAEAVTLLRRALAIVQKLYPKDAHPGGHVDLARGHGNLGQVLQARNELDEAETHLRAALDMRRALYPPDKFPQGHPELAASVNDYGLLAFARGEMAGAEAYFREALAVFRRLHPGGPHNDVANALGNLAGVLQRQGEAAKAEPHYREAVDMFRALYPPDKFPKGHPALVQALSNYGSLLTEQGESTRAEQVLREVVAAYRTLYPPDTHPNGQPVMARGLNNLAATLQTVGRYPEAEACHLEALAMRRKLYPPPAFPNGHPEIAATLNNLGALYQQKSDLAAAERYYREALAARRALYPAAKFPRGHIDLANSLNNLGSLQIATGRAADGLTTYRESLAMAEALFPPDRYPDGHPQLATAQNSLGFQLRQQGRHADADPHLRRAVRTRIALVGRYADLMSEAAALNFAAVQPLVRDSFLSNVRRRPTGPDDYALVWASKAVLYRISERRHRDLLAARTPEAADLHRKLADARQRLARLLLAPPADPAAAAKAVREATDRKEELERQLARQLRIAPAADAGPGSPADLAARLPAGAAFVDFLRYVDFDQDPAKPGRDGERRTPRYVAFVTAAGKPGTRIDLPDAAAVEAAWAAWRAAITAPRQDPAAERAAAVALTRLIWDPVRAALPAGTTALYLAPDAALAQVPWAALPNARPDAVVLEEYAVAVVPHGPWLLDRLVRPAGPAEGDGQLLVVGGVDYDQPGAAAPAADTSPVRAPARQGARVGWSPLAGTDREAKQVADIARAATRLRPVALAGKEASTDRVLAELPKARVAHLATHGFFADPEFRSAFQLDPGQFGLAGKERAAAGARSPLVLSGLVLAGANRNGPAAAPDRGVVTAESVVGLRLEDLDLAVLSACETGLGEVAGGEGVFGLTRAFHLAGCRTVVASLWKVDDDATAALTGLFYRNLWVGKMPPAEALRQAQLALLRNPAAVPQLARRRGADFTETDLPEVTPAPAAAGRTPTGLWAGFVLSGAK